MNKKRVKNLPKCQEKMTVWTGNLLDYLYHQKYHKLIGIDLSKQKKQVFINKLIS